MKKLFSLLLIICICFCVVGCNKVTDANSSNLSSTITEIETETIYVEEESSANDTTTEESKIETSVSGTPSENIASKNEIIVENIAFTNSDLNVTVGSAVTVGIQSNVEIEKIIFTSSDETIAKYFGGEILGKKKGSCKIIATTPSGVKAECSVTVSAKELNSGKCGENITWTFYDDFSLVFSGTGDMKEYYTGWLYSPGKVLIPWYEYSKQAREIIIDEGITSICNFAFIDSKVCKKIKIADSVTRIGHCAFEHWIDYEGFVLNKTLKTLGAAVFHSCNFNVYYTGTKEEFETIDNNLSCFDYGEDNTGKIPWNEEFKGTLLYYSETQQDGCWRYVNGVPTAW